VIVGVVWEEPVPVISVAGALGPKRHDTKRRIFVEGDGRAVREGNRGGVERFSVRSAGGIGNSEQRLVQSEADDFCLCS
jgi:hypothetical protein